MIKKLTFIAIFLCAAMVAHSEEGMRIGARVGYSMQNVGYGMGMLGFGAGLVFDIPVGPIFISPEAAILYRNNFDKQAVDIENGIVANLSQPELAVSIPLMIKFFPRSSSYLSVGVQVDIPIDPKICYDSDCISMDGKETIYERASYDISIIIDAGYRVTPSLNLDIRTIFGVTPHHTYEIPGFSGKADSDKMYTYGFGISYFFL
jgi:hypothetical protein